ncbi:MAG: hypothetical protein K2I40_06575 [Bifidobacterium castoris]|nr:hypothetical protein [Bifidobacterium castoris]
MAQDDGPSSTGEIAKRLERNAGYANVYATDQGGRYILARMGQADFKLPYMRDYLREHGAYHFLHSSME